MGGKPRHFLSIFIICFENIPRDRGKTSSLYIISNKVLAVVTRPLRNLDYDWPIRSGGQNNLLQRKAMSELQVVGCE